MTLLDIAQAARGKLRDGYSAPQAGGAAMVADMAYGTATADSSGGFVTIVMDNMPAGAVQSDYEFTVACDAPITNGDRVALVTINGTEKAISMGTLSEQVADVVNYFWADNAGVHVSTEEGDPNGAQNIVLNSSGLIIREGASTAAGFSGTEIQLCKNATLDETIGAQGTSFIDVGNGLASLKLRYEMKANPSLETRLQANSPHIYIAALIADYLTATHAMFTKVGADEYYDGNGNLIDFGGGVTLTTLYDNSTGTGANSTLTLSSTAADYDYLDIIFTDGNRRYTERLYDPNGKTFSLFRSVCNGTTIYHNTLMGSVSGTTVTLGAEAQATMGGSSITTAASTTLKVIKVLGGTSASPSSANGVSF